MHVVSQTVLCQRIPRSHPWLRRVGGGYSENTTVRAKESTRAQCAHNAPNMASYSGLGIALCESTVVREYHC